MAARGGGSVPLADLKQPEPTRVTNTYSSYEQLSGKLAAMREIESVWYDRSVAVSQTVILLVTSAATVASVYLDGTCKHVFWIVFGLLISVYGGVALRASWGSQKARAAAAKEAKDKRSVEGFEELDDGVLQNISTLTCAANRLSLCRSVQAEYTEIDLRLPASTSGWCDALLIVLGLWWCRKRGGAYFDNNINNKKDSTNNDNASK